VSSRRAPGPACHRPAPGGARARPGRGCRHPARRGPGVSTPRRSRSTCRWPEPGLLDGPGSVFGFHGGVDHPTSPRGEAGDRIVREVLAVEHGNHGEVRAAAAHLGEQHPAGRTGRGHDDDLGAVQSPRLQASDDETTVAQRRPQPTQPASTASSDDRDDGMPRFCPSAVRHGLHSAMIQWCTAQSPSSYRDRRRLGHHHRGQRPRWRMRHGGHANFGAPPAFGSFTTENTCQPSTQAGPTDPCSTGVIMRLSLLPSIAGLNTPRQPPVCQACRRVSCRQRGRACRPIRPGPRPGCGGPRPREQGAATASCRGAYSRGRSGSSDSQTRRSRLRRDPGVGGRTSRGLS